LSGGSVSVSLSPVVLPTELPATPADVYTSAPTTPRASRSELPEPSALPTPATPIRPKTLLQFVRDNFNDFDTHDVYHSDDFSGAYEAKDDLRNLIVGSYCVHSEGVYRQPCVEAGDDMDDIDQKVQAGATATDFNITVLSKVDCERKHIPLPALGNERWFDITQPD